jgi:hypothetical protein
LKKLVIKTTLITLASLIGAMAITFGAIALFAPGFTAGIFNGVGNYSATVFFYEKQYAKTQSLIDLMILVDKVDYEKDGVKAEKYLELLVNHKDFDKLSGVDGGTVSENEFYLGNYALVLAKNDKFADALSVSSEFVKENGYTNYNPYRILIYDYTEITDDNLRSILTDLLGITPSEKVVADVNYINNKLLG